MRKAKETDYWDKVYKRKYSRRKTNKQKIRRFIKRRTQWAK